MNEAYIISDFEIRILMRFFSSFQQLSLCGVFEHGTYSLLMEELSPLSKKV